MRAMVHPPSSDAARLRAVKRHVWGARHRFVATCAVGLEDLLEAELAALPEASDLVARTGGVAFEGSIETALAALVRLRVAETLRVELLGDAAAATYPMLHDHLTRVRWALWLPPRCAVAVRVRSTKSRVRDDAGIERSARQAWRAQGVADDVGDAPPLTVHLRLHRDRATVALDLGGALHRRTGAKWVTATTVRETTAAALARLADVAAHDLVLDPFCGSGTLVAEARALALGAPARTGGVPFEASPAWPAGRFAHALRTAQAAAVGDRGAATRWYARDVDPEAVAVARRNLEASGAAEVDLAVARAQDLDLAALVARSGARRPLLLANPPYGKGSDAVGADPDALVAGLLARAGGWSFALLYPRPEAIAALPRVRVHQAREVVTGGLRNAMVVGSVEATA
jgi:23S rRNA G2445 N2-methylase RlmL